jgi:hypothetical protein
MARAPQSISFLQNGAFPRSVSTRRCNIYGHKSACDCGGVAHDVPIRPKLANSAAALLHRNHQFIRSNAKARDACYDRWLPILAFKAGVENEQGFGGHPRR